MTKIQTKQPAPRTRLSGVLALSLGCYLWLALAATGGEETLYGGALNPQTGDCIPPSDRAYAGRLIQDYEAQFGSLSEGSVAATPRLLSFFPMAGVLGGDLFTWYFVDLETSGGILDWDCTGFTYDGHQGNDTIIRSFAEQGVGAPIFAAQDGVVVAAHDGEPDMNTTGPDVPGNFVIIDHGYGRLGLYWHFKRGSVLASPGERIVAGQQLGLTGSSGRSSYPHLHFELNDRGTVFEPYAGPCRPGPSGWRDQIAHIERRMYLGDFGVTHEDLTNHAGPPFELPRSGQIGVTDPYVRFWIIVYNLPANSRWRARFQRPDGTIGYESAPGTFQGNSQSLPFSWWRWSYSTGTIGMSSRTGTWRILLDVNDQRVIEAPVEVRTARTPDFNRPPAPIAVGFEPQTPMSSEVLRCRVFTSLTLDDPDYDVVRYDYLWRINGSEARRIVSAAHSDVLRRDLLKAGETVECSVTPSDGRLMGTGDTVSEIVAKAPFADCNGNGQDDSLDISTNQSADQDTNGLPDECEAKVLYVNADASGRNRGTSWGDAYTDLQTALRVAEANQGRSVREIWVVAGTYHPASTEDRSKTFQLIDGVGIYGGFAGNEHDRCQRNYRANQTILSGDLLGDDSPNFAFRSDNSFHVVTGDGANETAILDGFLITGGSADGDFSIEQRGGGMWVRYGSPLIANCTFFENQATVNGGGLYTRDSNPTMINCIFEKNRAGGIAYSSGGGLLSAFGNLTLTNCIFVNNEADRGGGVFLTGSTAALAHCTFSGNVARTAGGALTSYQGSHPTLVGCILWGNQAPLGRSIRLESLNLQDPPTELTVSYSDIEGGAEGASVAAGSNLIWGAGNLVSDPRFLCAEKPRLEPGSPCLDMGTNKALQGDKADLDCDGNTLEPIPYDVNGRPRFVDDPVAANCTNCGETPIADMGAFEAAFADLNGDGHVDLQDFAILQRSMDGP